MDELVMDLKKLEISFRRTAILPPLPKSAARLIQAIDSESATAAGLEKIIAADPALTAELMRCAGSAENRRAGVSSLRQVILMLGQRSVRAVAVSLSLRSMAKCGVLSSCFDSARFARHSIFVAMLARYLHARNYSRSDLTDEDWTGDEIFAAGILHDICYALLAHVDPAGFDRLWNVAQALKTGLDDAFSKAYSGRANELGALAVEAWGFPAVFAQAQRFLHNPLGLPAQVKALSCLQYADELAVKYGIGECGWPVAQNGTCVASTLFHIEEEELKLTIDLIKQQTDEFLGSTPIIKAAA